MFCPKCAAKNEIEQRFCRKCGQPLETVALVLQGHFEEALDKYEGGYYWLVSGLTTFGIFLTIAFFVFIFGNAPNAAVNLGIGLLIALPMIIKGIWQIESAANLLATEKDAKILPPAAETVEALPPGGFTTDSLIPPASVTERTTRDLVHQKKIDSGEI